MMKSFCKNQHAHWSLVARGTLDDPICIHTVLKREFSSYSFMKVYYFDSKLETEYKVELRTQKLETREMYAVRHVEVIIGMFEIPNLI